MKTNSENGELRVVFSRLASTTVNLLLNLGKLAGNVGSVAVKDRDITIGHLSRVVEHNNLGSEVYVKSDIVSRDSLRKSLVMHLDRLDLSSQLGRGKSDHPTRLDNTSLNTTHGYCSDSTNFVHILKGQSERLVSSSSREDNSIKSLQ